MGILFGSTHLQLLKSAGKLEIAPHQNSGSGGYRITIRDLDPVTGATGPAELGVTHGYTEERLEQLKEEIQDILDDPESTKDMLSAANQVLRAIELVSKTEGRVVASGNLISFYAPSN